MNEYKQQGKGLAGAHPAESVSANGAEEGGARGGAGAPRASAEPALALLKAAGDLNRLRILRLVDREELTVSELVEVTALSQSSVSRHLGVLRAAGLVQDRAEGTRHFSRLVERAPREAAALVEALRALLREQDLGHPEDLDALEDLRRRRRTTQLERFDALAEDWDGLRASLLGGALGAGEVSALLLPPGGTYLDVGTGTGVLLPWLSRLVGASGTVLAVEPSARMRAAANARLRQASLDNVRVLRGEMEALPIEDAGADGIVFSLSLGQAEDLSAVLTEAYRALAPGGRLVIADVERHPHDELVASLGQGFRGFDPEALCRAVEKAGFEGLRRLEAEQREAHDNQSGLPRLRPILLGASRPPAPPVSD